MDDAELKRLLETNATETRQHFEAAVERMEKRIDSTAAETRQYVDSSATETRRYVESTAAETRQYVDSSAAEMRRHFDVTAEGLRHQIGLVAEKVTSLDEKLDREAADIRGEMRRGFAETQAMIKFSHAELHRRVSSLEEGYADLLARVERLETSSTH